MYLWPHWRQHSYIFLKMIWWARFCLAPFITQRASILRYDRERNTLVCHNKPKCQISRLQLYSLFRKPKLLLVHCNIPGYKPATSGGPPEPSPVMLEKTDSAWKCCSHASQGKSPQHWKPEPLPAPRTRLTQSQTRWFARNGCSIDEGLIESSISSYPYSAAFSWSNN